MLTQSYEIFKVKNKTAPETLTVIFTYKEGNYNLINSTVLEGRSIETGMYSSETISSLGPKISNMLLTELKNTVSPTLFKKKEKKNCEWAPENYPCRLCTTYVQNIEFL